jgi:hypothetical protein
MLQEAITAKDDLSPRTRRLLEVVRRALIMILNEIEDQLSIPRSIQRR